MNTLGKIFLIFQLRLENRLLELFVRAYAWIDEHPEPVWFKAPLLSLLQSLQWLLIPTD